MEEEKPGQRRRQRGILYAIVSVGIWSNPKVCQVGPMGGLVFVFALTRNAWHGRAGTFPATEFEPWYLARQLGMSETEAGQARDACIAARLVDLDLEAGEVHIVGWSEEWKRADLTSAEAERKRAYRLKISTSATLRNPEEKKENREEKNRTEGTGHVPDMSRTTTGQTTKRARAKPGDPTEAELATVRVVLDKLTSRNKVPYRGSKEHTRLIVARLRDGVTEMDLRKVIGYCATELEWATKENMRPYLRPETLFGPETVQRYLDPARAWFEKLPSDQDGQKRAGATIHRLPTSQAPEVKKLAPGEADALSEQARDAMLALFPSAGVE